MRAAPYVMISELHYGLHSIAVMQVESAVPFQVFRSGHAPASDAHAADAKLKLRLRLVYR